MLEPFHHQVPCCRGVLDAVKSWYGNLVPLVRDPGDRAFAIAARGGEMSKAFTIAALTYGFTWMARRRGLRVNSGFSGFSGFDTERIYDIELAGAMRMTGGGHILMCHPGYPDVELAGLDPVVERRAQELESLLPDIDALLVLESDVPWFPHKATPRADAFVAQQERSSTLRRVHRRA